MRNYSLHIGKAIKTLHLALASASQLIYIVVANQTLLAALFLWCNFSIIWPSRRNASAWINCRRAISATGPRLAHRSCVPFDRTPSFHWQESWYHPSGHPDNGRIQPIGKLLFLVASGVWLRQSPSSWHEFLHFVSQCACPRRFALKLSDAYHR